MTESFFSDEHNSTVNLWCLLLAIPILLAAGILERSGNLPVLPKEESYRSNFSDTILESSDWRKKPQAPTMQWRKSTRPALSWRTPQKPQSSPSTSRRRIELFPKYRPGMTSDFDYITREEKPLIKVFEFGP